MSDQKSTLEMKEEILTFQIEEEFKLFPLTIKLMLIPAITLGLMFVVAFVWLSVNYPLWLLTEVITLLFAISIIKLFIFFVMDYPKLKQKMEEERLES